MTVYFSLNILIITSTCLSCFCTKNDEEPINWQPENHNDGWCISGSLTGLQMYLNFQ